MTIRPSNLLHYKVEHSENKLEGHWKTLKCVWRTHVCKNIEGHCIKYAGTPLDLVIDVFRNIISEWRTWRTYWTSTNSSTGSYYSREHWRTLKDRNVPMCIIDKQTNVYTRLFTFKCPKICNILSD
jgi:hypothetical protein